MTRWGALLLLVFLALGLSGRSARRATSLGVWAAAIVIVLVMANIVR